jgi:hypothetical protein
MSELSNASGLLLLGHLAVIPGGISDILHKLWLAVVMLAGIWCKLHIGRAGFTVIAVDLNPHHCSSVAKGIESIAPTRQLCQGAGANVMHVHEKPISATLGG